MNATPAAPLPAHKRYSIDDFLATTVYSGASFSADESRLLFHSNATGIYNAYVVDVSGGTVKPVTQSITEAVRSVSFFPGDDRLLTTRDEGGNENNHLYVRELDGHEHDLTPGPNVKAVFTAWRPDDQVFYVQTNERSIACSMILWLNDVNTTSSSTTRWPSLTPPPDRHGTGPHRNEPHHATLSRCAGMNQNSPP